LRPLLTGWTVRTFYMTGLILKLSYNQVGLNDVVGGVCGSCFFIDKKRILTANHVLNKKIFAPNKGYQYCQVWLIIGPTIIIEIEEKDILEYPEIDTTLIELENERNIKFKNISKYKFEEDELCLNEGFIAGSMPKIDADWVLEKLIVSNCTYDKINIIGVGHIKSLRKLSINAADMKLDNVDTIETSYGGIEGMSGGPLILKKSNEIIGLMSFGLPQNIKEKEVLFAININEIISRIEKNSI
jgi:hypothetical protein